MSSLVPLPFYLQVWPQWRAVKLLLRTWKKDPRARQEKARIDREVGGLEPFLEAVPTYIVCKYMYLNFKAGCHRVLKQML